MKRIPYIVAVFVWVLMVVNLCFQYGKKWELTPLPRCLLADEGHYADGEEVSPWMQAIIGSGYEGQIILGAIIGGAALQRWLFKVARKPERMKLNPPVLDVGLMQWSNRGDFFRRRDLLSGGVLIMGRPGSGKTSSSGATLGRAIAADPLASMLIICAKPEDAAMWRRIFGKRELLEFSPTGNLRCNVIDFVQGDTREVVNVLLTAAEALRPESGGGGEYGSFFQDETQRFLHHAVEILRQGKTEVSAPTIQRFINGAALSAKQLTSDKWREGFHATCILKAVQREKTDREKYDLELAREAWVKEWPTMATRTRSGVLACMLNVLFYFNSGIARELISTTTNFTPWTMLREGKSIMVACPSCEFGLSGTLVSTCLKLITQKAVLARPFNPGDFYNVIWADEAWQVTTSFDQPYVNSSRSHGGAMVYMVQSRDSFYAALGKDRKAFADGLMSGFHHRIFHSLGSAEDAQWAASLLGHRKETSFGGSMKPPEDAWDAFWGQAQFTGSFSESYQPVVQPGVFMNGLRCGGRENNLIADAIVIRSGEPFKSNGQNYLFTSFHQK